MKLKGKVVFRDIETGIWVLEGDDGRTYQLDGGDRKIKKDGQRVAVEGEVQGDKLSLGMVGPLFRVKSYQFE